MSTFCSVEDKIAAGNRTHRTNWTNLPHGRNSLLTRGQTDNLLWPARKPAVHVRGMRKTRETSKSCELAARRLRGCSAHHAGGAPDVGRRVVVGTDQDLHRAVLTRLDVLAEVFMLMVKGGKKPQNILLYDSKVFVLLQLRAKPLHVTEF